MIYQNSVKFADLSSFMVLLEQVICCTVPSCVEMSPSLHVSLVYELAPPRDLFPELFLATVGQTVVLCSAPMILRIDS